MLTNVLVGFALPVMSASVIVVIMMLAAVASALMLLPASRHLATHGRRATVAGSPKEAYKASTLVIGTVVFASALIQASHAYLYAFGSIEWRRQGISDAAIGVGWATGVAAEVVLFYLLGSRIRSQSAAVGLIIIGGLGGVLRWIIYAQPLPNAAWPLVQMMHALSFATTHLGAVMLINMLAPMRQRAFAQGMLAGVIGGVMALATLFSDDLYIRFKAQGYYGAALMAALGVLVALYPWRKLQPQSLALAGSTVPPS
jgi:MFS transporter, PPP family, 3-phenylpropionic acid transporter